MRMLAIYAKLQRFFEMAIGYAVKHKRYWNDIGLGNWREFTKKALSLWQDLHTLALKGVQSDESLWPLQQI